MSAAEANHASEIVDRVRAWPREARIRLATMILESIESPLVASPPKRSRARELFGMLRTAGPPPNDEECERILEEERMKRYG